MKLNFAVPRLRPKVKAAYKVTLLPSTWTHTYNTLPPSALKRVDLIALEKGLDFGVKKERWE